MKKACKSLVAVTTSFVSMTTVIASSLIPVNHANAQEVPFSCEIRLGIPTTVVKTNDGSKKFISWESNYFVPSGYTPETRCKQVTGRLNQFFNPMSEQYVSSGRINNTPVICITEGPRLPCKALLYTLKPDQDAETAINSLVRLTESNFNEPPLREGPCRTYLSLQSLVKGNPTATKICN